MYERNLGTCDWAIVGGGIHGTYLASVLQGRGSVRIVDPAPLMTQWRWDAYNSGMDYLRSPDQHNLGDTASLLQYALEKGRSSEVAAFSDITHPTIGLFNDHCQELIRVRGLDKLLICGYALNFELGKKRRSWRKGTSRLHTTQGILTTRNVVLAIGQAGGPLWPDWATPYKRCGVDHVFDEAFDLDDVAKCTKPVYVIGGGLSGVQLATRLAQMRKDRPVKLLTHEPVKVAELDASVEWTRLDYIESRLWGRTPEERHIIISEARREGTVPQHAYDRLQQATREYPLEVRVDAITEAAGRYAPRFQSKEENDIDARIVLATGFDTPGLANPHPHPFLKHTQWWFALPQSPHGYPVLDNDLVWGDTEHGRIFVSGELAALTLGPLAGNIRGAQLAAQILDNAPQ